MRVPAVVVIAAVMLMVAACTSHPARRASLSTPPSAAEPTTSATDMRLPPSTPLPASTRANARTSASARTAAPAPARRTAPPRPEHVVVVVLENHGFDEVIGPAPYLTSLAASGALFTHSFAITHPSQPNYLALFSGSTQGVTDDSCPQTFTAPNLARALLDAGHTFAGYSEDLPEAGFTGCSSGQYARKHAPWVDFGGVPTTASQPFTAFPADYTRLPTVSFVIPNLEHDMHDGTVAQGDAWVRDHLAGYTAWARSHRSLLVVTFDEDDGSQDNRIPTIIAGAFVRPGRYSERIDHYRLLRTLTDAYGLAPLGSAAQAQPITGIW